MLSNAPLGSAICRPHRAWPSRPIVSVRAQCPAQPRTGRGQRATTQQLQSGLVEAGADVGGISHANVPLSVPVCERSSASSSFATGPSPVMSPMSVASDTVAD